MKKIDKKVYLIISILLIATFLLLINSKNIINRIRENFEKEEIIEFEYKTYEISGDIGTTLVTLTNEKGLQKVTYIDFNTKEPIVAYPKGKTKFAFDYEMEDRKHYEVKVEFTDGETKTYPIDYEIPRIKGNYTLVGNTYANEPDLTRFSK